VAIAAHLHVLLRRKLGRVTDTEWMATNWDYAQEIVRVCRREADGDLQVWAAKLEQAIEPLRPKPVPSPRAPADRAPPSDVPVSPRVAELQQRYVGRLR
jgi:hypothetical protein